MPSSLNGCRYSNPTIHPEDYKKKTADLKKPWYIQYWFYDPEYKAGKGRLVIKKYTINDHKTLTDRREAAEDYLAETIELLKEGFNPNTRICPDPIPEHDYEVHPMAPLMEALKYAAGKLKVVKSTKKDIDSMLKYIGQAAERLAWKQKSISSIEIRHITRLIETVDEIRGESAHRFNKYRSYLMSIFKELRKLQAIKSNPLHEVDKRDTVTKIRVVLTDEERAKVNEHLFNNYYTFWRFMQIFFHSGGRESELLQVKHDDVDLIKQRYKVTVLKGRRARQMWRTIKDIALPFWQEIMNEAKAGDYLFSKGLKPGPSTIIRDQITRRWKMHVKEKLKIKADFYSLKHSNLQDIAKLKDINTAAGAAGHSTPVITMKHYVPGEIERQHEELKGVANAFAS